MTTEINLQNLLKRGVVDENQLLTMLGNEYEFTWIDSAVPAGMSVYASFVTGDKYAVVNFREVSMDQERGFYRFYVNPASLGTEGAPVPLYNFRGDATQTPAAAVAVRTAPAFNPNDARVEVPMFGAAGQGNQPTIGDLSAENAVRVLPPNTNVLLQLDNQSASAAYMRENVKFWEISPDAMLTIAEV